MNFSLFSLIYIFVSLWHMDKVFGNNNDDIENENDSAWLPNSCSDLSDGYHWMKLLDGDEYPAVYQLCNNGFMIIDYSVDSDIKYYFDSWQYWHMHTVGPTNDFSINWQQWYLPDTAQSSPSQLEETVVDYSFRADINEQDYDTGDSGVQSTEISYLISPDCSSCEEDNNRQIYDKSTTYWMTGTLFGCSWVVKATYKCNVDLLSDTCYVCHEDHVALSDTDRVAISDDSIIGDFAVTGVCPHNVHKSYNYVVPFHDECTLDQAGLIKHLKPSLGTNGKYCTCVQSKRDTISFETSQSTLTAKKETFAKLKQEEEKATKTETETETETKTVSKNVFGEKLKSISSDWKLEEVDIKLYQSDFTKGTYRIREAGRYTIMEDIKFDFKANLNEPNADGAYWPTSDDNLDDSYPGAGDVRSAYFMGFFAGITVECNDVVIDLNGHELSMSEYFYHQQRWFTVIELTTQYFLPGQGIGNFGAQPKMANNVEIKNGVLGLTSHHGIHGNYNNNIKLTNLIVRGFETHGIQFNGFDGIYMESVEVGPTSDKVRFTGEYGHMRAMMPRYRTLCEELDDEKDRVLFDGRTESLSMCDIADEVELQMNMAFDYVTKGVSYTLEEDGEEIYESFVSSMNLFVNPNGDSVPYGSAQFGIFLNTYDASVLTYSLYTPFKSQNAKLNNIKIHDLSHSMREYIRIQRPSSGDFVMNPFAGPLNAEEMIVGFDKTDRDSLDRDNLRYKGNVVLDGFIAMNYLSDNWGFLQMQIVGNNFVVPWAMGTNYDRLTVRTMSLGCNMDVMIHSGKGINGLRLDGVEKVEISNIEIYNLYESTPLGTTMCGKYDGSVAESTADAGHFRQTAPMQVGFSGNMNQGININSATDITIENAKIYNLHSETGPVFGISVWPSCDVTLKGDISVENMIAGELVEEGTFGYDDLPNQAPEMCGIRVIYEYGDSTGNGSYTSTVQYDEANIKTQCLSGHVGCLGEDDVQSSAGTMIGMLNADTSECTAIVKESIMSLGSASRDSVKSKSFLHGTNKFLILGLGFVLVGIYIIAQFVSVGKPNFCKKDDNFEYTKIEDTNERVLLVL